MPLVLCDCICTLMLPSPWSLTKPHDHKQLVCGFLSVHGVSQFWFFLALVCLATPESRCTQMLAVNGEMMSNIHSLNVNCSLSQKLQQAA